MDRDRAGAPAQYCDVALPVPIDQTYTYSIPGRLAGRVKLGCRVVAPFQSRAPVGVVLGVGRARPDFAVRPIRKLLDPEPALSPDLIELARWLARYYCAPIGEAVRSMLPLAGETLTKRIATITPKGDREFAASLIPATPELRILATVAKGPRTVAYLARRFKGASDAVRSLQRKGLVIIEEVVQVRDPTAALSATLLVREADLSKAPARPKAPERWLLGYLRRNPGSHDVRALAVQRTDAVATARRLAKSGAVELKVVHPGPTPLRDSPDLVLTAAQDAAFRALRAAVRNHAYRTFLLHGVTGSGKTEVYLRAIGEVLRQGRSALVLVPEIGLTPAVASEFFARFGDQVSMLHSGLAPGQRADQWRRIRSGKGRLVLGTRSAVFAPVRDLGLVVVDEEHDTSYKQEGGAPRYSARDVGVVRGRNAGAVVVLGSATPCLESRRNAETGKYTLLEMPERVLARPLPEVEVIDMRDEFREVRESRLFSRALVDAVQACLARGEQAMIFLNRRGFANFVLCRSCGARVDCPNCSVTLTYHKRDRRLLCHFCDHAQPVPTACGECGREYLQFQGSGSERVQESLQESFPSARVARLDRDTVQGRNSFETILGSFRDGDCNLLVGTQMIAKGHDIPNVTLVCVVNADIGLGLPDFRAAERTFQLLTQVAGRAGRGEKPGQVLIQTVNPEHYAVAQAARQDYRSFYEREMMFRGELRYPPFSSVALLLVRHASLPDALGMSRDLARHLRPVPDRVRLIGPASAPVSRLRAEYRFQFLVQGAQRSALAGVLRKAREFAGARKWSPTALTIDVDPVSFL